MFLLAAGTGALLTLTGSFMLVSVALNVGAGADTAPYELYCPGTPVGTIVLNGVQTTGELSPAAPTAGSQFDVVNYQTTLDIPSAIVTAAAALGNTAITGWATTTLDATGATPATMASPELSFDVTIPDPVPSGGLTVSVPSSPATVGPFTATSSDVTIAQDSSTALTLVVSGDDLSLTCTAYPNNSAPTGISSSVPTASPISPVVAQSGSSTAPAGILQSANGNTACEGASNCSFTLTGEDFGSDEAVDLTLGSGTTSPGTTSLGTATTDDNGDFSAEVTIPSSSAAGAYTITAVGQTSGTVGTLAITISASSTTLTGAYQLYCPGTPVGDVVLNEVVTSAAITPTSPTSGSNFNVTGYQTQVSIPTALAVAAYALDPTSLSGTAEASIDLAGATPASMSAGTLSFDVPFTSSPTAPVPVDLPSTPATLGPFTATSTDITVAEDPNASLSLDVAGTQISLVCTAFPNDTPDFNTTTGYTGIGEPPASEAIAPIIAIAGGSTTPPSTTTTAAPGSTTTTIPSGPSGEYELYCPGTPVGTVVLNDVVTTASISPASPATGSQFNVTDFQVQADIPASLATAAAALGNSSISGSATVTVDASGATPASIATPTLSFDVAIPSPVPSTGIALSVPTSPGSVGPFTASGGAITLTQASMADLNLVVSGNTISLNCVAYPNNSAPSGITTTAPSGSPISPVIATAMSQSTTTTTTTTTTTPPVLLITSAECAPGCQLGLSGSGFQPEETVALMLNPAGNSLGQATADESGDISATVTIPAGTSAGDYTVVAQGESSGDTATVPVTVTAATTPTTSSTTTSSTTTPSTTTSSTTTPSSTTTSSTTTTSAPGATTSTTAGPTTTAAPAVADASATSVAASSSGLAFTGTGPGVRLTAIIGSSLLLLGLLLLLVIDTPKLLMRRLVRRKT